MNHPSQNAQQTPLWHRSLHSTWMLAAGVILAAALLTVAFLDAEYRSVSLVLLLAAASFLAVGAIKVSVTPRGVAVTSALLPFLRRRIPLHRIDRADARWTRPMEIGGWGYRWKPGLRAVSLREGDALWLTLDRGKQFVITIDDAGTAAELINSHAPAAREGRETR
ncbi:hypothetical protein [Streptomyces eurocidicus]|uniref:Lipoprotein n=1 Tax=Streptomyces eurocidicus TaxID=66423 RepID=A0A7W8B5X1_STREU|nr:hypothetical protein [Streptomyces eurocidicus]MBB5117400.1 hypothetical protein [Streptomyces eurocidicus]MBF6053245.1 hypothetical protein [Streptomyces eurocidicus]